jgi:hypothetical protein
VVCEVKGTDIWLRIKLKLKMEYYKTFEMYTDEYMTSLEKSHGKEFADMMRTTQAYKKYQSSLLKPKKIVTVDNITKNDIRAIMGDASEYSELRDVDEKESIDFIYSMFMEMRSKNPLILYRALAVESEAHIDKENVGMHYVMDKMMLDGDLFMSAGIGDNHEKSEEELEYFILSVIAKKEDIDIEFMIRTNAGYNEAEVTLKPNAKVKIIDIEKRNMD